MGRVGAGMRRRSGPPAAVEISSTLAARPDGVWAAASTLRGVNHELGPWIRMTGPQDTSFESAEPGRQFARSWLLLFGVIPFDYDDLTFARVRPGAGFLERSRLLSASTWEHERTIEPVGGGCRVTDRVRFTPRIRSAAPLQSALVAAVFRHRHRRLRGRFGELSH